MKHRYPAPEISTGLRTPYGASLPDIQTKRVKTPAEDASGGWRSAWLRVVRALVLPLALVLSSGSFALAKPLRIVALGDSLTAGYGLSESDAFPNVLERALKANGHAVEIINAGVSGDTTSGGLARLDWSIPDGTDGVILELGANDALRGIDPALTRKNLDAMLTRLAARKIPVLLAGMYSPRNNGPEFVRAFESIFPDLATKHRVSLYPFFLDGVAGQRQLSLPDGIHPNPEGVRRIVSSILPAVETFVTRIRDGA